MWYGSVLLNPQHAAVCSCLVPYYVKTKMHTSGVRQQPAAINAHLATSLTTFPAGVYPDSNTLYVQCLCGRTAPQCSSLQHQDRSAQSPTAPLAATAVRGCSSKPAPQLWGLPDWVEDHAGGPHIPAQPSSRDEAEAVMKQLPASLQGWDHPVSAKLPSCAVASSIFIAHGPSSLLCCASDLRKHEPSSRKTQHCAHQQLDMLSTGGTSSLHWQLWGASI